VHIKVIAVQWTTKDTHLYFFLQNINKIFLIKM